MKKIISFCCSLALVTVLFCSCEDTFDGNISFYEKELFLFGDFTNANGNSPAIAINRNISSGEIRISDSANASIINNRIEMQFPNIRIKDELGIYKVNSIITEEWREEQWVQDVENKLQAKTTQLLDVVLVLDVSSSLGGDVKLVKEYAEDFIHLLFNANANSRIGIVGFSENIFSFPLSNEKLQAISFVRNLQENLDATKLYEAMDAGITLLENSNAEGKALVTFTDGRNNSWSDVKYEVSGPVYNRLLLSEINSYTIGLKGKGGIEEGVLKNLAVNGLWEFPNNTYDLLKVFDKFANSVVSTYSFIYDRNSSPISIGNPIRLRFRIQVTLL